MSLLFGTIYDAVVLLAHALNRSESHGAGLSGAHLGDHTGSLDVAGFNQRIWTDKEGRRLAQYIILDTDDRGSQLVPTHTLDADTWQVQTLNRAIHFPGGAPPACDSNCWFDPNKLCVRGNLSFIYSSVHPPTHPSIDPSIHPSIHLSIHQFIHPSFIHSSIHPSFIKALHVDNYARSRARKRLNPPLDCTKGCEAPGKPRKAFPQPSELTHL